jgi:hypothetical protein
MPGKTPVLLNYRPCPILLQIAFFNEINEMHNILMTNLLQKNVFLCQEKPVSSWGVGEILL